MARGTVAFVRYLRMRETIDVALGVFEAESSTVAVGRPCHYLIRIVNVSHKLLDVNLILEWISNPAPDHPTRPSARVEKYLTIPPLGAMALECHCDWGTSAIFAGDTGATPAHSFWVGEMKPQQLSIVRATLCDMTGNALDTLEIYQERRE
jgi:hypothetical protein